MAVLEKAARNNILLWFCLVGGKMERERGHAKGQVEIVDDWEVRGGGVE